MLHINSVYHQVMLWLQLRFDYDTTMIQLRSDYDVSHVPASIRCEQKIKCKFFVVVVSQSNRTHVVISISFVVVEWVVISSYRNRVVVESQLWYRLNVKRKLQLLPSFSASPLLADAKLYCLAMETRLNDLPRIVTWQRTAGCLIRNLLIMTPTP